MAEVTIRTYPINSGQISYTRNNLFPLETQNSQVITTQNGQAILVFDQFYTYTFEQTTTDKFAFEGWYLDGVKVSSSPTYELYVDGDYLLEARYTQNYYSITLSTTPTTMPTPYQSKVNVNVGSSVEIRAREINGYTFIGWDDGNLDNPRTLVPTADVFLVAEYKKDIINETYYQYRGFIKDQLAMTEKPKAFIIARKDKDKEDLSTKATSTITCKELPSNVKEGDVVVLYTAKGVRYYQGVISKIKEETLTCTQMQSFFNGVANKSYVNHITHTYLEDEIKAVLQQYQSGVYYSTTYTDTLVRQRLNGFTINSVGSQQVSLPTDTEEKDGQEVDKNTEYNIEQFMYDCFNDYGVVFEFSVNYEGDNYITISTPDYEPIVVGNNQKAIVDLSPITTIEQTNKLIIFNADGTYRTTFVARKDGEIVEAPTLTADRFEIVKTKIVKSDDENDVLIKANLPQQMYNHKLTFKMYIDNNIYDWQDLKLGVPLHIFIDGVFFDTIITAREVTHNENQKIKEVLYTCGKVRLALTDLLNMGKV